MGGRRADSGRDRDIAAAYVSGLTIAECTVKFGAGRAVVRGALERTGTPFRRPGRRPGLDAEGGAAAAERYLAGYGAPAVAAGLGVSPAAARRAVLLAGTPIRSREEAMRARSQRLRREAGEYPWAAEAAARHRDERVPVGRLAAEYGVSWRTARAAIIRQGVTVTPGRPGPRPGGAA